MPQIDRVRAATDPLQRLVAQDCQRRKRRGVVPPATTINAVPSTGSSAAEPGKAIDSSKVVTAVGNASDADPSGHGSRRG